MEWMALLKIVLTSIGSVVALFLLTKLMGNRQMSQLSMFDYINGITIGSIAAEMATSIEGDFLKPLTAMTIYALFAIAFSVATDKSIVLRRFLTGETLVLYDDGKLFEKNFKKSKLDINEFLTICRNNGYFNLANLQTALLEPNGKISFLPISICRPATPQDMNLSPAQEKVVVNVVIDGNIMKGNLKYTGNDERWLQKKLEEQNIKLPDVLLATCDSSNNLSVYNKRNKKMSRDMFE